MSFEVEPDASEGPPGASAWTLNPAVELSKALSDSGGNADAVPEVLSPKTEDGRIHNANTLAQGLGNFNKLFEHLGVPAGASPSLVPALDPSNLDDASSIDDATLGSPPLGASRVVGWGGAGHANGAECSVAEEPDPFEGKNKAQRKRLRRRLRKEAEEERTREVQRKLEREELAELAAKAQAAAMDGTNPEGTPTRNNRSSIVDPFEHNVGVQPAAPVLTVSPDSFERLHITHDFEVPDSPSPGARHNLQPTGLGGRPVPQGTVNVPSTTLQSFERRPLLSKLHLSASTSAVQAPLPQNVHGAHLSHQVNVGHSHLAPVAVSPGWLHKSTPWFPHPVPSEYSSYPVTPGISQSPYSHLMRPAPTSLGTPGLPGTPGIILPQQSTITGTGMTPLSARIIPGTPGALLDSRRREDRQEVLLLKLLRNFPEDKRWLVSPMGLLDHRAFDPSVHVFVDASNIFIGFGDALKRIQGLHPKTRTGIPDISLDSLTLLMERRRPRGRRVIVGSDPELPAFDTARVLGYETHLLGKVKKARPLTEKQKFWRDAEKFGYQEAQRIRAHGTSAGCDPGTGAAVANRGADTSPEKWVEQGVDEIVHIHMLTTIYDYTPTTIVLATGDAAEGEYSAGFLSVVERALDVGWNVELVSWRKNTSSLYRDRVFRAKWGEQFRMIELDEYVLELLNHD